MIFYFLVAVGGTLLITFTVKKIAVALGIVDKPDGKRKRHAYPVPLWGGLALFVCWWLMIGYVAWYDPLVFSGHITTKHLIGIFLGSLLILVLGLLDDRKSLSPSVRFVGSVVAVLGLILFFMIALQCMSTVAVAAREMGSIRFALIQLVVFNLVAYSLAVAIVQTFKVLGIS
jgi:UDP-N-acetylmuramyl pentapeptide phosphotransferase/UDP-N-acetylglucosamine-1-phosphate transferase